MGFKSINPVIKEFIGQFDEREEGEVLVEGVYLGTYPNKYNADKPNFKFKDGVTGDIKVVNTAGHLHYLMVETNEAPQVGDYLQVVYQGKEKITKGTFAGKEAHKFEVLRDDERSIVMATQAEAETPAPTPPVGEKISLEQLEKDLAAHGKK